MADNRKMMVSVEREGDHFSSSFSGDLDFLAQAFSVVSAKCIYVAVPEVRKKFLSENEFVQNASVALETMIDMVFDTFIENLVDGGKKND